jgi:hypothetical protein
MPAGCVLTRIRRKKVAKQSKGLVVATDWRERENMNMKVVVEIFPPDNGFAEYRVEMVC